MKGELIVLRSNLTGPGVPYEVWDGRVVSGAALRRLRKRVGEGGSFASGHPLGIAGWQSWELRWECRVMWMSKRAESVKFIAKGKG